MSLANLLAQARRPLERDGHNLRKKYIGNENYPDCVVPFQDDVETPGTRASGTGGTGNASASGSTRTTLRLADVLEFSGLEPVEPVEPVQWPTPGVTAGDCCQVGEAGLLRAVREAVLPGIRLAHAGGVKPATLAQLLAWLQDASQRDATEFFSTLEISGKLVPIRAARAAHNAPVKIVTRMTGGVVPWLIVGHRAFNAKELPIIVGDNEEERRGQISVGRGWVADNSQVRCGHSASIRLK